MLLQRRDQRSKQIKRGANLPGITGITNISANFDTGVHRRSYPASKLEIMQ
jgi:hypothetical protein